MRAHPPEGRVPPILISASIEIEDAARQSQWVNWHSISASDPRVAGHPWASIGRPSPPPDEPMELEEEHVEEEVPRPKPRGKAPKLKRRAPKSCQMILSEDDWDDNEMRAGPSSSGGPSGGGPSGMSPGGLHPGGGVSPAAESGTEEARGPRRSSRSRTRQPDPKPYSRPTSRKRRGKHVPPLPRE